MADFYARYPSITLQLQEMSQEKIEDMLCRDELDVGIAFAPVHSPELEAIPLLTESLALVVAQHHPLAVHEQVALSRLHDEKLVLSARNLPPESKLTTTARNGATSTGGH